MIERNDASCFGCIAAIVSGIVVLATLAWLLGCVSSVVTLW